MIRLLSIFVKAKTPAGLDARVPGPPLYGFPFGVAQALCRLIRHGVPFNQNAGKAAGVIDGRLGAE